MDYPLYPNSDPSAWCTTIKDTARWCADLVTEELRAKAAPGWRNFPRVVFAQIEHDHTGFGFRAGDLFCTAFATHQSMFRLDGMLSSRNVDEGNPSAPDILVRVWCRPDGQAGWAFYPDLTAEKVDPAYQSMDDPAYRRIDPLPQPKPWKDDTGKWLGLTLKVPDDPVNWMWELDLQPYYARYGDWEPL